jgi:hypothetical protein
MAYNQVTVGSGSAVLIVANNTKRLSLVIVNNGSSSIYMGGDSLVTISTGLAVQSNASFQEDSGGQRGYQGDFWAISSDSNNVVCYWERVQ